ncbi:MAG: hypothetical protein SGBAC_002724 [Bacillariaceae sp.]
MTIFNIFNTKKCKSIKSINATTPEVKENPNKYIPKIKKEQEDADENKKTAEDKLGRELRYKIDIFATPVLNSLRTSDKSEEKRTLSKHSVDSLCEDLENLILLKTTKTASESETESESDAEEEEEKKSETCEELKDTGRVDGTTFNYRTNKSYKVKRSARIANKY